MKLLAFDTTGIFPLACVIIGEGEDAHAFTLVSRASLRPTGERIFSLAESVLAAAGTEVGEMDMFGCVTGPGSFTGIRIGVTMARTLGMAMNKPVVGVNSFERLAYNATGSDDRCAVYAYGDNFYTAAFDARTRTLSDERFLPSDEAREWLTAVPAENRFADDRAAASLGGRYISPETSFARALLAAVERGAATHYSRLEPYYILESQAEREQSKRQSK